jgi:hypothetical protein
VFGANLVSIPQIAWISSLASTSFGTSDQASSGWLFMKQWKASTFLLQQLKMHTPGCNALEVGASGFGNVFGVASPKKFSFHFFPVGCVNSKIPTLSQ